jgi:hypothetical protein
MKAIRLLILGLTFLYNSSIAQKIITVQSGLNISLHESLDSAIANSVAGDHIYLPGGTFNVNDININKSVMIFGTGHYLDSSLATGITSIDGNILLVSGASGGLIIGCLINGNISVGNGTAGSDSVSNFTISRCNFNDLRLSFTGMAPTLARGFSINENIIQGSIMGANALNINFSKNIIEGGVSYFNTNCMFRNNDFIGLGNCPGMINFLTNVSSCVFENNIILYSPPACSSAAFFGGVSNNNVFTNNLMLMNITFPQGSNAGFSNYTGQALSTIFISASGDEFSYTDDYHLQVTSPGYHGATDNYDVGIYGTLQPYKTAGVPFNPHIQQKSISTSTNSQGQLNIQIRAGAQDY